MCVCRGKDVGLIYHAGHWFDWFTGYIAWQLLAKNLKSVFQNIETL